MDIRAIIQSIAVRLFADCDALFHLCDHRNAGIFQQTSSIARIYTRNKYLVYYVRGFIVSLLNLSTLPIILIFVLSSSPKKVFIVMAIIEIGHFIYSVSNTLGEVTRNVQIILAAEKAMILTVEAEQKANSVKALH